jgi:drug/metabolite transporter (DMT)-like permease
MEHNPALERRQHLTGIGLAVLAALIWSGNFVVARAVIHEIPPISLAFYRWGTAVVFMFPLAFKAFKNDRDLLRKNWKYMVMVALFGITLYNSTIYMAGKHLPAVNLSLITTTSSPVFSLALAAIFLNEKIGRLRLVGILVCFSGILYLLCLGSLQKLLHFHFSPGDGIVLLGGLFFAIYNTLVRKKPAGFSSLGFLFSAMAIGTIMLFPAFLIELNYTAPVAWSGRLVAIVLYLGIGNSVICYLLWNKSIELLGTGRTALFGNLIPLFSSIEAVFFLNESISSVHLVSALLIITGLVLANLRK